MLNIALLETAIIMAISGCAELQKKTTQQEKESTTMVTDTVNTESGNYYETYEGILPCADCGGIRTTQKINSDTIYQLWSEYLGKKNGVFEEISICNMLSENILEMVVPSFVVVALVYAIIGKCRWYVIALFSVIMAGIWGTAIYSCHHYIIDVLLGISCALLGWLLFEYGLMKIRGFRNFFDRYYQYIK